jgi:hypothetical protein
LIDIAARERYPLDVGLLTRALLSILTLVILVVPVVQLMTPVSPSVMHQLSAKTGGKTSTGSRVPAVTGDTTALQGQWVSPVGRVSLLDGAVALPGFTTDLFVPPRA